MRKLFGTVLLILMLVICFAALAEEFSYDLLDDGSVRITGCELTGDIEIPESIDGYTVSCLDSKLFFAKSGITSVSIPATVTYFGANKSDNTWDYVFSYCYSLKSIMVAEDNPSFSSVDGVLYNKEKAVLLNYPCDREGEEYHVPSNVEYLACTSFASNMNLVKLYLDGSDTYWRTYTFYNTPKLTVYYLAGGITEERVQAFAENGLTGHENGYAEFEVFTKDSAPDTNADPKIIAEGTCGEDMTWKQTDDGVLTISGTGTIQKTEWPSSGVNKVIIESGVTAIGKDAFEFLKMKSIEIPGTVKTIAEYAFWGCSYLQEISFPSGLETVGEEAFHFCSMLKRVEVSDTVRSIHSSAFLCCPLFSEIEVDSANQYYSADNGILYNKDKTKLCLCPPLAASGSFVVPEGVTEIGAEAFWQCDGILTMELPDSLIRIEDNAFHFCENMTRVSLPDSLTKIGRYAFQGCYHLEEINIPAGVWIVGKKAFELCDGIKAFNVAEGNSYFSSVNGVLFNHQKTRLIAYPAAKTDTAYEIPEGVKYIEDQALVYGPSLQSISFPKSLSSLGEGEQFAGFTSLKEFIVDSENNQFRSVDGVLFSKDMKKLIYFPIARAGEYIVPDGVNTIGDYAFQYNKVLTDVILPDGVTSIGKYAFYNDEALAGIRIPDSVTEIDNYAFCRCLSLQNISYGGIQKEWDNVGIGKSNDPLLNARLQPISATFILPEELLRIESEAFANLKGAIVRIPEKVSFIADDAFADDTVILCKEGSYAESRCESLGLKVKAE